MSPPLWLTSRARLVAVVKEQRAEINALLDQVADMGVEREADQAAHAEHLIALRKALEERAAQYVQAEADFKAEQERMALALAALLAERPKLIDQLGRMSIENLQLKAGKWDVLERVDGTGRLAGRGDRGGDVDDVGGGVVFAGPPGPQPGPDPAAGAYDASGAVDRDDSAAGCAAGSGCSGDPADAGCG